ncbi:MAG: NUDIX domain-containing protein [Parachlamydiaceae bacterium]|nr:NUDIX domain-containing protein [Parachlamydiaceae bacterium]
MKRSVKKSVIGIVFNSQKDQILLVKRRDVPMWVLPGGGIDPEETPQEAAIREVFEETGLSVNIQRHIATYTPINRLANLTYVYECQVKEGSLTTGAETRDLAFFELSHLPIPFFFVHRDWLNDAMANSHEIIFKPITQVNYYNLFKYFCCHPYLVLRFAFSRFGMPINFKQ